MRTGFGIKHAKTKIILYIYVLNVHWLSSFLSWPDDGFTVMTLSTHDCVFSASGVVDHSSKEESLFLSAVGEVWVVNTFRRSCSRTKRRITGGGNITGGCNGDCGVTIKSFSLTVVASSSKFVGDPGIQQP